MSRRLRTRFRTGAGGVSSAFDGAALNLNFAAMSAATFDPRITFSRGTAATLTDSTGKITYAPNNLLTYSQEFENVAWVKSHATVTANSTTAPDGTLTADKLVETTANNAHSITQFSGTVGATETFSVFAKQSERQWIALQLGGFAYAYFNLATGVVGTSSAATATISNFGDGWYRCAITAIRSTNTNNFIYPATADGTVTYAGNGTSGIFIWGAQLEQVTYQTAPSAYYPTTSAAYYGPRFDYNPVTRAPKGLLIEEQRTNLFTYSEQFDNAAWSKSSATVTANATTSPDGTVDADKLVEDTTNAQHFTYNTATVTANTPLTFSAFLKTSGRDTQIRVQSNNGTFSYAGVNVNLSTGAQIGAVVGSGASNIIATITPYGNGWYRITITATLAADVTSALGYVFTYNGTTTSYTGDGVSGVFVWGAQLEAGLFATSYIPTVASQVTRSADIATMTGTNFSGWYNQSEGAFAVEVNTPTAAGYNSVVVVDDGTSNNVIAIGQTTSGLADYTVQVGGAVSASFQATTIAGTRSKMAAAYALDNFARSIGGGTVSTDTSGTVPAVTAMRIGNGLGSRGYLNGHILQIVYFPTRLSNAQLQTLTSPPLVTTLALDFINGIYEA